MPNDQDSGSKIEILIRARYPLIYVVSFEENRVGMRLKDIADERKKQVFNWTITNGLELPDGSWVTELKKDMKKKDLMETSKLSPTIVARMSKNKPIDGSTLERICAALQCQPGDVIEYVPDAGK
jgi:DNA-binding Xre family transcriptional regulator